MGDWGIKVSKVGKSITSTTPEDYIFNSKLEYGSLKTIQQDGGTITANASSDGVASINHPFGFVPSCMVFMEHVAGSGNYYFGSTDPDSYITNTALNLTFYNSTGSQVVIDYYYFMFGETAEFTP